MLKRVSALPETKYRKSSFVEKDVREFARNKTYDVAEVVIEGRSAKNIVDAAKKYIRYHEDMYPDVWVCLRGNRAFLYRKLVTDD